MNVTVALDITRINCCCELHECHGSYQYQHICFS